MQPDELVERVVILLLLLVPAAAIGVIGVSGVIAIGMTRGGSPPLACCLRPGRHAWRKGGGMVIIGAGFCREVIGPRFGEHEETTDMKWWKGEAVAAKRWQTQGNGKSKEEKASNSRGGEAKKMQKRKHKYAKRNQEINKNRRKNRERSRDHFHCGPET